jgi:Na+/melibiose symporter-like transporter
MGLFVVVILPIMVAAAVGRVSEPPVRRKAGELAATVGDYFRLFRRDTVRRLLITDLMLAIAPSITGALFFFYFERVKGFTKTESEILLLFYFLAAIAGGPVWGWLAKRHGKTRVMIAAAVSYAVVQICVVFLPAGNLALAIPFLLLAGLPYSSAGMLLRAMLADVGDEERLITGIDRTGLLYAILTGTGKVGAALAVGVTFFGLAALGFKAGSGQASSNLGLMGLQGLYAIAPAVLGVLAACAMIGYPLTQGRHVEIRRQLAERDAMEPDSDDATHDQPVVLGHEAV